MSSFLNGFLVLSVMFAGSMSGFQASIIERQLHLVPAGLKVTTVVYAAERVEGDTAGAPNAGVVVYAMPKALAVSLQSGGAAALAQALTGADFSDRGWRSTPVVVDETWLTRWHSGPASDDLLLEFVVESGIALTVNDAVMKLVHDALISPGAYFAASANAVVVLIPEKRRIAYAYRGDVDAHQQTLSRSYPCWGRNDAYRLRSLRLQVEPPSQEDGRRRGPVFV